jgi:putative ABC transport system ATP-binding protein
MEKITLRHTLPNVFMQRPETESDVWNQDIEFQKEELYLVEANSGTGKSSLCSYIFGYRNDYQGTIMFDDTDISRLTTRQWVEIRQKSLSLLWQELRLFPELTAMENVEIKNKLTGFQTKEQILKWFEMLGIDNRIDSKIGRMSFGQQQRVALIRALCQPFDFIFVDEPISHLDDTNSRIVGEILTAEARRQGAGVILTSIGKHIELNYDTTLRL